ncbi:MAG: flagellar motor protein MotB [Pseudomonadota bacterium]|nr:flagellar motor protein MotB [Pseudomonadota bacterium]
MSDHLVDKQKPLVLKKRIKANHAPHGGAWKVAYADFVTAMMAFFLLLWLLNVTTESNKQGISNYFEPDTSEEEKLAGSGQALAGLAEAAEGALKSAGSPPRVTVALATAGSKTGGDEGKETVEDAAALAEAEAKRLQAELESFAKVEAEIRQALQEIPELNDMQDSLMIDYSPDGLRIQILDDEDIPMFAAGRAVLNDHGRKMLAIIANVITKMPNLVVVTGHTDSSGGSRTTYGNWELSGDRANTARRVMVEFGLGAEKIAKVSGKADREHLFPEKPNSVLNRRISIILQKQKPLAKMPDNDQQASILEAQDS